MKPYYLSLSGSKEIMQLLNIVTDLDISGLSRSDIMDRAIKSVIKNKDILPVEEIAKEKLNMMMNKRYPRI